MGGHFSKKPETTEQLQPVQESGPSHFHHRINWGDHKAATQAGKPSHHDLLPHISVPHVHENAPHGSPTGNTKDLPPSQKEARKPDSLPNLTIEGPRGKTSEELQKEEMRSEKLSCDMYSSLHDFAKTFPDVQLKLDFCALGSPRGDADYTTKSQKIWDKFERATDAAIGAAK